MTSASLMLPVPGGSVSAEIVRHRSNDSTVFVLAHGAGGSLADPLLVDVSSALVQRGHTVLRFNFLYREARRKLPDRSIILEATYRGVLASMRQHVRRMDRRRLIIGGKSMGGRMASHLVAAGEAVDGLLLLGYPLHPAKRPDKLRDAHLPDIRVPTLFVQGTKDALCELALLAPRVARMGRVARLEVLEGADHGLSLPRRVASRSSTIERIANTIDGWSAHHVAPKGVVAR